MHNYNLAARDAHNNKICILHLEDVPTDQQCNIMNQFRVHVQADCFAMKSVTSKEIISAIFAYYIHLGIAPFIINLGSPKRIGCDF